MAEDQVDTEHGAITDETWLGTTPSDDPIDP